MAYLSWDTRRFPESPREAAADHEERLHALEREIESPITWKEAARQLSFEDDLVPEAAPLYWKIVEVTLRRFNGRLEQLRSVDAELERQHVPLSLVELVLGEPRYDWIPNPESSPLISWWNHRPPWHASALATIRGWLDVVANTKPFPGYASSRACIVGFYY